MKKITIAGASGYIGTHLIEELSKNYQIKALSRGKRSSGHPNVTWKEADLFSLSSTTESLADTDIAIYLVHSMLPSTRLFQGSFHDTDLMLADNFACACKQNNVKQIIYLGGLVPQGHVSQHLESRKEVEVVLKSTGIPCTVLRAGLVVGNGGSSFEILKNLASNLPAMVLPQWTQSTTQVIYVKDLVQIIAASMEDRAYLDRTLNVTNGENLKYKDLIELTIERVGKKTTLIPVPINYTSFSKLWVTVFGQSQYELVSPLVDSLLCDFSNISPDPLIEDLVQYRDFRSMLDEVKVGRFERPKPKKQLHANSVRSIQRLATDVDLKIEDVADYYTEWLPKRLTPFLKVRRRADLTTFCLLSESFPLLTLKYIPNPDVKNRVKFHVVGGLLSKTQNTGWLEFRSVANNEFLLASINEFIPSLPWFVYKYTQAPMHKYVMIKFGKDLSRFKRQGSKKDRVA